MLSLQSGQMHYLYRSDGEQHLRDVRHRVGDGVHRPKEREEAAPGEDVDERDPQDLGKQHGRPGQGIAQDEVVFVGAHRGQRGLVLQQVACDVHVDALDPCQVLQAASHQQGL